MRIKVLSRAEFSKNSDLISKGKVFSKSPFPCKMHLRKFSFFAFGFGCIFFLLAFLFQFWTQVFENPQTLSGKPYFNLLVALPFAFEISLLAVGMLLFARFLLVNSQFNKNVPEDVLQFLRQTDENNIVFVSDIEFGNNKIDL